MVLIEIEEMECPGCHILYWISGPHKARLVKTKESYYCPNGHGACFVGKTDAEKLKEEEEKSARYYESVMDRDGMICKKEEEITKYKKKLKALKKQKSKKSKS